MATAMKNSNKYVILPLFRAPSQRGKSNIAKNQKIVQKKREKILTNAFLYGIMIDVNS